MAAQGFPKIDPPGIPAMSLADGWPQRVLLFRNRDRMNMIGHQTIPPDVHAVLPAPVAHQLDVTPVVIVRKKGLLPAVAAPGHVMRIMRHDDPGDSGHALNDQSL